MVTPLDEDLARLIGAQEWELLRLRQENCRLRAQVEEVTALLQHQVTEYTHEPERGDGPRWPSN